MAIQPHFLGAAHLVDDALVDAAQRVFRQRPAVVRKNIAIDVVLALGLLDRHSGDLLGAADFLHHAGTAVQQFDQLQIDAVDPGAAVGEHFHRVVAGHARVASVVSAMPQRSARAKPSSSCALAFCSINRTKALPTTTPSAIFATAPACSGVEMPKPTASGKPVMPRILRISGSMDRDSSARSPVTPLRDTR